MQIRRAFQEEVAGEMNGKRSSRYEPGGGCAEMGRGQVENAAQAGRQRQRGEENTEAVSRTRGRECQESKLERGCGPHPRTLGLPARCLDVTQVQMLAPSLSHCAA